MSLATLLLIVWLILMGLWQLGILAVSVKLLGILALIAGILFLVDAVHPITVLRRP